MLMQKVKNFLRDLRLTSYAGWGVGIGFIISGIFLILCHKYNLLSKASCIYIKFIKNDTWIWYFGGFQNPATSVMEGIIDFHHDVFFFLIVILIIVSWFLFRIILIYRQKDFAIIRKKNYNQLLEILWTIFPTIVLIIIAIPSLSLLYAMNEMFNPEVTMKMIGNQWYWTFESHDWFKITEKTAAVTGPAPIDAFLKEIGIGSLPYEDVYQKFVNALDAIPCQDLTFDRVCDECEIFFKNILSEKVNIKDNELFTEEIYQEFVKILQEKKPE